MIFVKIAIFSEIYLPYLSGISSFISVLRKSLISLGHEVLVITSSTNVSSTTFEDGILRCPAKSANNKYGMSLKNSNNQTMLKKILEFNPDIIHINTDTAMGKLGLLHILFRIIMRIDFSTKIQKLNLKLELW